MGGRGSSGKSRSGGGGAASTQSKLSNALNSSPGMAQYNTTQTLEEAPVGTKIYDGSNTTTDRSGTWKNEPTYYEKTSNYGWTKFGDTDTYSPRASNQFATELVRKSKDSRFNLRVTK